MSSPAASIFECLLKILSRSVVPDLGIPTMKTAESSDSPRLPQSQPCLGPEDLDDLIEIPALEFSIERFEAST